MCFVRHLLTLCLRVQRALGHNSRSVHARVQRSVQRLAEAAMFA